MKPRVGRKGRKEKIQEGGGIRVQEKRGKKKQEAYKIKNFGNWKAFGNPIK